MTSIHTVDDNLRPPYDREIAEIASYVVEYAVTSEEAFATARSVLMDSLGCAMLSFRYPECTKLLGPMVPGTVVPGGARVPGTGYELDPVKAAFDSGILIRWLDYNDTWLAAEWGHPSDNLGGILAVADFLSRKRRKAGAAPLVVRDVLAAMIKAHEIQGGMALENSFNRQGYDHVALVKLATTAVVTALLGGGKDEVMAAISQVWVDGLSLRTYRHAPNTGARKSWAAGDATSRGVRLALLTMAGEAGYPSALTAPHWGLYDVAFGGEPFRFQRPYGSYVMENVLFKISFPAEFHAQTAVECALRLHEQAISRLGEIAEVVITTQQSAIRIISKTGPLYNPADRDHCIQYMVAVALIFGTLTADHYQDDVAADPRIDRLRDKMRVVEDERYSREYLDPEKRSIANALQLVFTDGTASEKVEIEYPVGHRRRRAEGLPLLRRKFAANIATHLPTRRCRLISEFFDDQERCDMTPVDEFMELFLV